MKRELLIEHTPDLIRTVVLEEGILCEIHQERRKARKLTDSLFLGRVQAIRPSVGAAFVDIGEPINAFLPLPEKHSLRCGDFLIVQGAAVQAVETKGLRISDTINLAGKWLVLVPDAEGVRISKKIKDPALREELLEAVSPLCPQGCSLIVRTASGDVTCEALQQEATALYESWLSIKQRAAGMTKPGLLHAPMQLDMQMVRDIGSTLSRIVTNDKTCYAHLLEAKENGWVAEDARIEHFEENDRLMCDVYGFDTQVDKALRKRVWLDCGGYLVFDDCEAMTVIDVNSAKMTLGKDTDDTAYRVNMEAAKEIARQLRLRDIGGMIVVDCIDMKSEERRAELLDAFKRAVFVDRAQVHVLGMTRLGLVEMTRKRKGEQLNRLMQSACKICGGDGRFLSAEETAHRALRQVKRLFVSGQRGPFLIRCSSASAALLEQMHSPVGDAPVYVLGENGRHADRFDIQQLDAAKTSQGAVQLIKG